MNVEPVTLNGRLVRLEPLTEAHVPDLVEAGQDEAIWRLMPYGLVPGCRQLWRRIRRGRKPATSSEPAA